MSRPFEKWVWHGIGGKKAYERVCDGEGLKLPSYHTQVVDVGDWGHGVYFTTSRFRAHLYARDFETPRGRRYPLVFARVELKNPLRFDFRSGMFLDPKSPSNLLLKHLEKKLGSPVRGHNMKERARAARRWRKYLLSMGYDGVLVRGGQDTEVVVYRPQNSIVTFKCFLGRPR